MDLVEAPIEAAADAVAAEMARYSAPDPVSVSWRDVATLQGAFETVDTFDNAATQIVLLPTRSRWTVLWNNSFLCDGYDALCWGLSANHRLTTLHWSASDEWTTFQSGAMFHWRRPQGASLVERRVQAAQTDKRWDFFEEGDPLPQEETAGYLAPRKRDRLNEAGLIALLARLGAQPWSAPYYALPGRGCMISRPRAASILVRPRADVLKPPPA